MDKRLLDVMDPTSFGTDTVTVDDGEESLAPEEKSSKPRQHHPTTILTEDVDWGDRGHRQPVLL